ANVVGKNAAELVVLDLADEGPARPEARRTHDGVRCRAAGNLHRRTHGIVESRGLPLVDQLHGTLAHLMLGEESVVRARDHVDDAEDVVPSRAHPEAPQPKCARTIAAELLEAIARRGCSSASATSWGRKTARRARACVRAAGHAIWRRNRRGFGHGVQG